MRGDDTLSLGAQFKGGSVGNALALIPAAGAQGVDGARDMIRFATPHKFANGDAVRYDHTDADPTIGIAEGDYFVHVVDDFTVQLFASKSDALNVGTTSFGTGSVLPSDRLDLAGYANGDRVTYRDPVLVQFRANNVDANIDLGNGTTTFDNSLDTIFVGRLLSNGTVLAHTFSNGDKVIYRTNGSPSDEIGGLNNGQEYYVITISGDSYRVRLSLTLDGTNPDDDGAGPHIGVTPIAISGSNSTNQTLAANQVLHWLVRPSLGGLEDGKTYQVINAGADGNGSTNDFQLANPGSAVALNLSPAERSGTFTLSKAGLDIGAAGGSNPHELVIDMTGGSGNHKLLGQGDVSLRSIAPPPGDGKSAVSSKGGGGGVAAFGNPNAAIIETPVVTASLLAASVTAGGNVEVTSVAKGNASAYAINSGGGFIQEGNTDAAAVYSADNQAKIGAGTVVKAGRDVSVRSTTSAEMYSRARAEGGGFLAFADADSDIVIDDGTISGDNGDHAGQSFNGGAKASIGAGAQIEGRSVSVQSGYDAVHWSVQASTEAGGFTGTSSATAREAVGLDADIDVASGASVIEGREGVDLRIINKDITNDGDSADAVFYGLSAGDSHEPLDRSLSAVMNAGDGVTIIAGPRIPGDTALDTTDLGVLTSLALLAEITSPDPGSTRSITWNADVVLQSGPSPTLVVNSDGLVTKAVNLTVDGGQGVGYNTGGTFKIDDIINDDRGQAMFKSNGAATIAETASGYPLFTFRDTYKTVRLTNESDHNMQVSKVIVANRTEITPQHEVFVRVSNDGAFEFDVTHEWKPTLVTVENTETTDPAPSLHPFIEFTNEVDNPIGITIIHNALGDIFSSGAGVVRTDSLEARADLGSVGYDDAHRLRLEIVESNDGPIGADRFRRIDANTNIFIDERGLQRRDRTGSETADSGIRVTFDRLYAGHTVDVKLQHGLDQPNGTLAPQIEVDQGNGAPGVNVPGTTNVSGPTPGVVDHVTAHFRSTTGGGPAQYIPRGVFGSGLTETNITYVYGKAADADKRIIANTGDINVTGPTDPNSALVHVFAYTDILTLGNVSMIANGDITVTEVAGDLRVGRIASVGRDVKLNSPRRILDATSGTPVASDGGDAGVGVDADVTGRNIMMTAGNNGIGGAEDLGGIGTPNNFLEINVDVRQGAGGVVGSLQAYDTAAGLGNTAGVFVTEVKRAQDVLAALGGPEADGTNALQVHTVDTKGNVTLATTSGSIRDARNNGTGDDLANVFANTVNLFAVGGSVGDPAAGAEYGQAQLNGNNDLEVDSQYYAPGTIAARATNHIYLTEVDKAARVVLLQALTGDVRFTVRESDVQGEDLNLLPSGAALFIENAPETVGHGLVNTPQGTVMLRVGDNINTDPNAQILAGHNVNIFGDFRRNGIDVATPNDSPKFGTVMHLSGVIGHGATAAGYLTRIFGNDDVDQIYFDQTFLGVTANSLLLGGTSQTVPQGGAITSYSGGKTRAYGSNAPSGGGAFAPLGDGEDFFIVNALQSMAYLQTDAATSSSDTLTIDGQSGSDTVVVNTTGSLGADRNYVINVLDSGAPDDGVDMLAVWGRDSALEGTGQAADDIFLLRRTRGISAETSGPSLYADDTAFVAVLHDTLAKAVTSDPNADSSVRNQSLERINYDSSINGRVMVFGQGGNDVFAVDDNAAITTLDGGTGDDSFQIGQIYGLQRDGSQPPVPRTVGDTTGGSLVSTQDLFPVLTKSLTPQTEYGTVATTRGWLSAGATSPLLAQGGQGNDTFTVYSNQAVVRLEGDDGNDLFTVRAFALAETVQVAGHTEIDWIDPEQMIARPKLTAGFSTAAETEIRTGAGSNQVEYNINAPVSVDGGNGFDKLVILGTEFADHIVVTDKGIFGAGLTVTYQNIEVLEIDALEGDDTIDVLSTQPNVATRVIGGLGNDQINVAGDVAGEVVSRDIEGSSGVINNRLGSADPAYDSRPADGIDTSIARGTQGQVIIEESAGFTEVREGSGVSDTYIVYLAKAPEAGKKVYVTVSGAMSPQEEHGNNGLLGIGDINANLGTGDSLLLAEYIGAPVDYDRDIQLNGGLVHIPARAIVLVFDSTHWQKADAKTVSVGAVDDTLAEGDRTVTISHSVLSADPYFNHAIVRNVEVLVRDNDQPGIIVTQLDPTTAGGLAKYGNHQADNASIVLEGTLVPPDAPPATGVQDLYAVELAKAPTSGIVRVAIKLGDSEAVLSSADGRFHTVTAPTANDPGVYYVEFTSANWNSPVLITVSARYDSAPEDPHNTTITHSIDLANTTDTPDVNGRSYNVTPVVEQRVYTRVIDDENSGVFQLETAGTTLVSAGSSQDGHGSGDSYTQRLTHAPTSDVRVALITDGQTDIVAGGSVAYAAVGDVQVVEHFTGNFTISGSTVTRAADSNLGSWIDDGFTAGMKIRIEGVGDFWIAKVAGSVTAQALTLTAAPTSGAYTGVAVNQLVERGVFTGSVKYDAAAKPFLLYAGQVTVSVGNTITRSTDGSFIDDGFAVGKTITFGDGSGAKYVVTGFSVDGHSMTVSGAPTNGNYTGVNKMLGMLTRLDGGSWLDNGFLEGQLFQTDTFGASTFKIDLITDSVAGNKKLDLLVISDPARVNSVVPNAAKLVTSGTATMSLTQWAAVLTHTTSDWYVTKTINLVADPGYDVQSGHENFRMFPKVEHRLDGIRGPLMVEGGATSADRSIAKAILLPGETNALPFKVPPQPPEWMSIDTLNIYDDGSHQNLKGTLTSTALTGLNMGTGLDFSSLLTPGLPTFGEPGVYPGGISFGSISLVQDPAFPGDPTKKVFSTDSGRSTIEVLNVMLGEGNDALDIHGTLVPGPDHDPLTGLETQAANHGGITAVHGGGNAMVQVNGQFKFNSTSGALSRVDGLSWATYGLAVGQRVVLSTPSGAAAFTVTGFGDQPGGTGSVMLLAGASGGAVTNQPVAFEGSVSLVDDLSVSGSFTVQSDRIIRTDNLPWQNLGFAIGQQVAFTTGGVTKLYTITDFDNGPGAGFGSALLLTGNTLGVGAVTGTVAVASRNFDALTGATVAAAAITRTDTKTWVGAGFAAGQTIAVSGQPGTLVVKNISLDGKTLNLQGGAIAAASIGSGKTVVVGIVRVGGDTIKVDGASAVFTGTFNVAPGQITRTDATRWDTDLHFALGQQITVTAVPNGHTGWITASGETVAQLVVTGFSADGKTLMVSGTPLAAGSFAATVDINSPLVVYGDTSQDAVWYKGKNDKLSLGKFSDKPMPHEDALTVSFGSAVLFAGSAFQATFGTITRTTGNWTSSGFVPEGLITVDGVLVGTISQVSLDGKTLYLFRKDLTTSADLTALWEAGGPATGSGAHTIVQRNRLGQNTDFFVFPIASAFQYAGNDVIDASQLYAAIPAGQLPAVGLTIYGGRGDDTIIGSRAGDHLAGGSGNDTILGQRGVDLIYGDAGFNVDFITRVLTNANSAGSSGAKNLDPVFAGRDLLYGDTPGSTASNIYGDYDDVIFGDHGNVTQDVAGKRDTTKAVPTLPQALQTTLRARIVVTSAPSNGVDDQIYGNGGQDILLGGTGNDAIDGGAGMDLVFGDHASLDRTTHLDTFTNLRFENLIGTQMYSTAPTTAGNDLADGVARLDPRGDPEGRAKQVYAPVWGDYVVTEVGHTKSAEDTIAVYRGNDYIAGGAGDDTLLGELGTDVIQGDGSIDFVAYKHEYDAVGVVVVTPTARGRVGASRGADSSVGSTSTTGVLTWFSSYDSPTTDGQDYVEGGGGNDVIFGNQGQDDLVGGSSDFFGKTNGVSPTVLARADAAGRPDGSDLIFGGSGTQVQRNDAGAATINASNVITPTATGHADDSDMILGDNGDIIRLVAKQTIATAPNWTVTPAPVFLSFNYDDYTNTLPAAQQVKILPRLARLLDYTPGGPNYSSAALGNIGGNDEVHGESGDDFIYGMKGDDRLYGDGQDDDIVGGWGNDWISGGTGDDAVIGDDGRIFTSRNSKSADPLNADYLVSQGEALYGIVPLGQTDLDLKNTNGNVLNEFIYTPGNVQTATINFSGALKKTVDITPFSTDVNWDGSADEYGISGTKANGTGGVGVQPLHVNDDIIFGGLGSDWLHGGSGDDAISGAEALPVAAAGSNVSGTTVDGVTLVDNLVISGWLRPFNPGNVLAFDPVDANGQHADHRSRAGEFALYDEYNPLSKIMVAGTAAPGTAYNFLLNFNPNEGVAIPGGDLPKVTGQNPTTYGPANNDGGDRVFGDLGNDWLVGGTGRDDLYGGMGNDLMNADDNHDSTIGAATALGKLANNIPDTQPSFEDRAFGGGGRDVLIANTGGDRLIDWTGEFNSYLVPFAPFGMATVSRTMQPQLPEFLYALSGSDGADATRYSDKNNGALPPAPTNSDPMPSRNGEPFGELGLVLQKDDAWHDTHGGPSDPQAGNIAGGKRDVLRTASFDNGTAQGFSPAVGNFTVANGRYQVDAASSTTDAISLFNEADTVIPSYFEMQATINAVKPIGGNKANAYLIFDYQSATDFKYAGINISTNKFEIGHRTASGWVLDKATPGQFKAGIDYVVLLSVNGSSVTLTQGTTSVSFTFAARIDKFGAKHGINDGIVGIGALGAAAQIDDVVVQAPPGAITLDKTVTFAATSPATDLFGTPMTGTWTTTADGRFLATATLASTPAVNLMNIGAYPVTAGSLLEITTTLKTGGQGGVVFDYQGASSFKYAILSADGKQVVLGHHKGSAWITDASYSTTVSSSTDYKLTVSLRGGLVNVSLNGAVVASKVYNETVTEGRFGLISFKGASSGQTSFDIVQVRTDEAAYAPPPALLVAAAAPTQTTAATLSAPTAAELTAALNEARQLWAATGLDAATLAHLNSITVQVADLDGLTLGEEVGDTIVVDVDAAGYGWFIDHSLGNDNEFQASAGDALQATRGTAAGRMDLLTVMSHELGHAMGLGHSEVGVMSGVLQEGQRITPSFSYGAPMRGRNNDQLRNEWVVPMVGDDRALPRDPAAPSIDWAPAAARDTKRVALADRATQPPLIKGDAWQARFVNHLGATPERLNPNASLRLHASIAPRITSI